MVLIIIGIILGAILGLWLPLAYFPDGNIYFTMVILMLLDAVFFLLKENLKDGIRIKRYGFVFLANMTVTLLITYAGTRFQVPIYYGCYFAFAYRIYQHLNEIIDIKLKI